MSKRHCNLPCIVVPGARQRAVQTPTTVVFSPKAKLGARSFCGNCKKTSLYSIKWCLYLLIAGKLAKVLFCEDVLNTTTTSLHDNDPSHDRANTLQIKPASDNLYSDR